MFRVSLYLGRFFKLNYFTFFFHSRDLGLHFKSLHLGQFVGHKSFVPYYQHVIFVLKTS